MVSYDKSERGRQHLNGGHERITYKKIYNNNTNNNKNKKKLWLTQSIQWVGVDHAARIHWLKTLSVTGSAEKNKMIVMMTMMI